MGKFTLDVPDELLKEFDKAIKGRYQTRAEAIRDAINLLLQKLQGEKP